VKAVDCYADPRQRAERSPFSWSGASAPGSAIGEWRSPTTQLSQREGGGSAWHEERSFPHLYLFTDDGSRGPV
jgi:hypothetical protein